MFCGKCSNTVPDGAEVRPTGSAPCGKKPNKKLIAGIIGIVAIVALVIVLIFCGNSRPKSMAEDIYTAIIEGDGNDLWNAMNTDAFIDILVDEGLIDKDNLDDAKDICLDKYDDKCKDVQRDLESEFGKDFSYEIKVTKVKSLSDSELSDFEDILNSDGGNIEITKGVAVTIEFFGPGDEDGTMTETLDFYKINGEWFNSETIHYIH